MTKLLVALTMVGLMVTPVLADQFPLLVKQVIDETAFRFDEKSSRPDSDAIAVGFLAAEAMALHEAGRHAEAIAKVEECAKLLGLTLQIK